MSRWRYGIFDCLEAFVTNSRCQQLFNREGVLQILEFRKTLDMCI